MYPRLAQVEPHKQRLAAEQGDDGCQVHRHEGLALAADGGGDGYHHGLIARSEILQRGAYAAEALCQRAARLLNNGHLGAVAAVADEAQDGRLCRLLDILLVDDLVVQQVDDDDGSGRNKKPEDQGQHVVLPCLGLDACGIIWLCLVDDLVVRDLRGHGNACLGPLLKEEIIDGAVQVEVALYPYQLPLRAGKPAQLSVDLGNACLRHHSSISSAG